MIKNQRLQKRSRVVARAKNPKSGHGRDEVGPKFKVGDVVVVHSLETAARHHLPHTHTGGTVIAVDPFGKLQIRYSRGFPVAIVDPRDEKTVVVLRDEDSGFRCTAPTREQEQQLREIALAKHLHWEQQRRADEMALASVVLSKRELIASGELCTSTSPQGVLPVEVPTPDERVALMRVLYTYTDQVDQAAPTGPDYDHAQTPWPAHQDRSLMKMATERLEQGDCCAALMLIKWATATVDTTRHSLTYQKPKLASRISKLHLKVNQWMVRHAAYLPLYRSTVVPSTRCDSVEELMRRGNLDNAARRLALAMCLLPQSGTSSPADCLDFDTLRRTARIFSKLQAEIR